MDIYNIVFYLSLIGGITSLVLFAIWYDNKYKK